MTRPLVVVYDDASARAFAPFALTRPVSTLRAGAEIIARRWARAFAPCTTAFCAAPHVAAFHEFDGPRAANGVLPAGTIIANSRCVVALTTRAADADLWRVGDEVAAVRLRSTLTMETLASGARTLTSLASNSPREARLAGRWLQHAWDIIGQLPDQLAEDTAALAAELQPGAVPRGERLGTNPVVVDDSAIVEPHVVFDASAGPIIVRAGAHIEAFTRIAGPCVIGEHAILHGGRINGSSIGEHSRVHGDLSASVFLGHANKAHEGFVGHTIVGRWANLGAGTTTSNLKNSYGPVKMWSPAGERSTRLTFLGSLIGDHAKLGIGTTLATGTVVGAGANVYGGTQPSKRVPPFAWGEAPPYEQFALDKFFEVAARVMQRRSVSLDAAQRTVLTAAHALAGSGEW